MLKNLTVAKRLSQKQLIPSNYTAVFLKNVWQVYNEVPSAKQNSSNPCIFSF